MDGDCDVSLQSRKLTLRMIGAVALVALRRLSATFKETWATFSNPDIGAWKVS